MNIKNDFQEILDYAHYWNWAPDWLIVKEIYEKIPESYSVLTPFAYAYLEELIQKRRKSWIRLNTIGKR